MEQRQDEQNARRGRDFKRGDDLLGHRGEIGVVEHDSLRPPGRAARIDEQGEIAGLGPQRRRRAVEAADILDRDETDVCPRQLPGRDGVGDHDLRPRVRQLVACLAGGQRRVDRGHRHAHAPRREQREYHLHAVRQHRRDDVTGADAQRRQPSRQPFDGGRELAGGEAYALVLDAGAVR